MATDTQTSVQTQALVKITEMDHIVLRNKDVEASLKFYTEVLGLKAERVEQWRSGEIRFPSARINADTIIDFFGSDQEPIPRDGIKNQDHFCMVIEPTNMEELKAKFEAMGVGIQAGPGKRWGSHGDGISLYIYDPDDNVVELRHY
ncbi:MAG TPA: VOC family virulence protein [Dehalococcoidia bacterium]|nr:VOC family virulence protein [Chloroflexota bacterium]MQF94968.1 VOC family virulence protein [SAR202 cluster bacterium]HAA94542.1 VOC family virulence protein [Dehalococcoidia bacterium]HCL24743.1 VOC family virulence protein [Dehalococcoidia bacterium]|tara:strand:- start:7246 stop:7683 length:438 start_codon:yes stop_codon:yes gene_type:complete